MWPKVHTRKCHNQHDLGNNFSHPLVVWPFHCVTIVAAMCQKVHWFINESLPNTTTYLICNNKLHVQVSVVTYHHSDNKHTIVSDGDTPINWLKLCLQPETYVSYTVDTFQIHPLFSVLYKARKIICKCDVCHPLVYDQISEPKRLERYLKKKFFFVIVPVGQY
jgi:hypothetical protein